jgi:hypothetical protein
MERATPVKLLLHLPIQLHRRCQLPSTSARIEESMELYARSKGHAPGDSDDPVYQLSSMLA